MTIVCAWCNSTIGEKVELEEDVSHGICESCAKKMGVDMLAYLYQRRMAIMMRG